MPSPESHTSVYAPKAVPALHTWFAKQNNMRKSPAILQAFMFLTSEEGLKAFRIWRGGQIAKGNL
jgi:hypothetical protein